MRKLSYYMTTAKIWQRPLSEISDGGTFGITGIPGIDQAWYWNIQWGNLDSIVARPSASIEVFIKYYCKFSNPIPLIGQYGFPATQQEWDPFIDESNPGWEYDDEIGSELPGNVSPPPTD